MIRPLLPCLLILGCTAGEPVLPMLSVTPPDVEIVEGTQRTVLAGAALQAQARLIVVTEPVAGQPMLMVAAPLAAVLPARPGTSTVLQCLDGYRVELTAEQHAADGAWLAWAAWGRPSFQALDSKGKNTDLGPYYLVWTDGRKDRPWPYQVHLMERLSRPAYGPITPTPGADPTVAQGFGWYESHCAKCHRIAGLGGDLGPELGCPVNVTRYWDRAWLARWLANPAEIRRDARMPPSGLTAPQIEAVIRYLEYAGTAFPCP